MLNLMLRIIKKIRRISCFFLSLPLTLMLLLLFPFYKIKLIPLISDRIGHYTVNTELLLCYLDEIRLKEKKVKYLFYLSEAPVCNEQLTNMWKRVITIVPFPVLASYVDFLMFKFLGKSYKGDGIKESYTARDEHERLKKHPPHLFFTDTEIKKGNELLVKLGIPVNAPFVCLLVRDSAYLDKHLPGQDWSYHSFRDCDINNFKKAATFLANKGYYVIRMGKFVEKSFDVENPKIIDYAQSELQSDFADIYLSAHCHFFISTSSGLDGVAQIFRKPILFVNVAPFKHQLQYWYPCEYFIVKKIIDLTDKKYISMKTVDCKITQESNVSQVCNQLQWAIEENTEDEILSAVKEMEEHVSKKANREIKNIFQSLLLNKNTFSMIPNCNWLVDNPELFYVKIGAQFWKENETLFSE